MYSKIKRGYDKNLKNVHPTMNTKQCSQMCCLNYGSEVSSLIEILNTTITIVIISCTMKKKIL